MKLRPEQRKLWRKTFHQERDRGVDPKTAAERADEAVASWEERGAFDEEQPTTFHPPYATAVHVAVREAYAQLVLRGYHADIWVAYSRDNVSALIPMTPRGYAVCESIRAASWEGVIGALPLID